MIQPRKSSTASQKESLLDELETIHRFIQEAQSATNAKSQFIANISHELRTPLNGVLGAASILADMKLGPEAEEFVKIIQTSSEVLIELVNDILDLSKIESGKMLLENIPIDLRQFLHQIASSSQYLIGDKSLSLVTHFSPDTPATVIGDPVRLRQVLSNYISNAIKFTERGHVLVKIYPIEQDQETVLLRFDVEDTGIGIEPGKQQSIFESFSQGDASTTRKFGGTGLGLAIVKKLVLLMGGSIHLESKPGYGSTFSFQLRMPLAASLMEATQDVPPLPDDAPRPKARVLLVEDSEVNQKVAQYMLEKLDCIVDTAWNGEEAVGKIGAQSYDLIFMDCNMPIMDGYNATRAIRRLEEASGWKRQCIVAMTANTMPFDRQRCLDAGMDDYVGKPVFKSELNRILSQHFLSMGLIDGAPEPTDIVNLPRLDDIVGGNKEAARKLADTFLSDSQKYLARLHLAVQEKDGAAVSETLHTLKGIARNLGIDILSSKVAQAENVSLSAPAAIVGGIIADLEASYIKAGQQLSRWAK